MSGEGLLGEGVFSVFIHLHWSVTSIQLDDVLTTDAYEVGLCPGNHVG